VVALSRVISVRVSEELFKRIEELSKRLMKKRSEVVLEALISGLKFLHDRLEELEEVDELARIIDEKGIRIRDNASIIDIVSRERD